MRRTLAAFLFACAGANVPAQAADDAPRAVRIATFNASLNRAEPGALIRDLSSADNAQARAVAEIVQRVRPDILLLQEFDFDEHGTALALFQSNYLARSQRGGTPLVFGHVFSAPSNTGVASGFDLDNDGTIGGPGDAHGFGQFPGQYGMALLSRFPIDRARVRTFREFLWRDVPGALIPRDWYTGEELAVLRLSSKSHWDVPLRVRGSTLHVLASHPTPPAFDGAEDRNGRRNHDEIRLWRDFLSRGASYLRDDAGRRGGLGRGAFVIMGDLNSDPLDGDSLGEAIRGLLAHPRVNSLFVPQSAGGIEAAALQGGANAAQRGEPRFDTADFSDRSAGNLRVDYLLPSRDLRVCGGGTFWPARSAAHADLVWGDPPPSSDHRLVWLDVNVTRSRCLPDNDPTASAGSHRHP